ncbi:amidohydrolase [Desulfotomaculum copahuensis]|uniref:5-methylthioadenosine/S-adenosylhomocysteine deaminase n=1 Tax=Desulfotomaculum copahuensis TaxID=1838280 RepID=A0A1B7LDV9_9FIRM|nr:amidohydrolase [Desulfotomaculum copahuensis]OAT81287.1 N-ethylammeline chlorohydrolase [Desulfotomaculum copahuensis]
MGLLIRGAAVLTMADRNRIIDNGEIAAEGQYISHTGPAGSAPDRDYDRVIDGHGMLALPGLVNCHTHAAMTLFRSYADDLPLMQWLEKKIWPLEEKLEPEDVYWGTLLCCLEMIRSGTTTFADMYFHMNQAARAVEKAGLRAVLSRGLIGAAPGADKALDYSRRFVRDWQGAAGGRITTMLGPHAPYTCPPDFMRRVIELAGELNVGIHIHLAETRTEIEDTGRQYGKTPVALMDGLGLFELPVLAAHCVHLTAEDIRILAEKQAGVAHNPESNMKLASGIAPVTALLAAGAVVGLGTDGAASNNNLDLLEEMRSAALLQKVATMDPMALPAFTALSMATVNGARALGLPDVGLLKPGCKADIILVNLQRPHLCPRHDPVAHLVYAAHSADVDTVIVDGRILMEKRQVLTIDEEEVLFEVQKRADRLTGK